MHIVPTRYLPNFVLYSVAFLHQNYFKCQKRCNQKDAKMHFLEDKNYSKSKLPISLQGALLSNYYSKSLHSVNSNRLHNMQGSSAQYKRIYPGSIFHTMVVFFYLRYTLKRNLKLELSFFFAPPRESFLKVQSAQNKQKY